MIFTSIRHNLANLLRFSGRDSRALFWPYAIAIFLLAVLVDILLFVPVMLDTMTRVMDYARVHPGGLPKAAPGQPPVLPPELMPDMKSIMAPITAVTIVYILLLAAAVVRRLHDCGKSGWWGAMPLPFKALGIAFGLAVSSSMTSYPLQPSPLSTLGTLNGAVSLAAWLFLVVLLIGEGTREPNRFGDPVRTP